MLAYELPGDILHKNLDLEFPVWLVGGLNSVGMTAFVNFPENESLFMEKKSQDDCMDTAIAMYNSFKSIFIHRLSRMICKWGGWCGISAL